MSRRAWKRLPSRAGSALAGWCVTRSRDRLDYTFEDMGEQQVKNIARPVRVYRVRDLGGAANIPSPPGLPLADTPSIAVLPFANMSGDPEQEFFADGITEDIITRLSGWRAFPVIARTSTFTYRGRTGDITKVGEELGVRYIVEGSVRNSGSGTGDGTADPGSYRPSRYGREVGSRSDRPVRAAGRDRHRHFRSIAPDYSI